MGENGYEASRFLQPQYVEEIRANRSLYVDVEKFWKKSFREREQNFISFLQF